MNNVNSMKHLPSRQKKDPYKGAKLAAYVLLAFLGIIVLNGLFGGPSTHEKEQDMLEKLQTRMESVASVELDSDKKEFKLVPFNNGVVDEIAYVRDTGYNSDTYDELVASIRSISNEVSQELGSGYSITLRNPAKPSYTLIHVKDNEVLYDVVRDGNQ